MKRPDGFQGHRVVFFHCRLLSIPPSRLVTCTFDVGATLEHSGRSIRRFQKQHDPIR